MATNYIGMQTIADYCGVARTVVYQWLYRHGPDSDSATPVPEPAVALVQQQVKGETKKTYGWSATDLPQWRKWYADLRGWDEITAAHRWVDVDAKLNENRTTEWLTSL